MKDMDGSEGRKLRLSRSLSRFETQDIKTQLLFNHYLFCNFPIISFITFKKTSTSCCPNLHSKTLIFNAISRRFREATSGWIQSLGKQVLNSSTTHFIKLSLGSERHLRKRHAMEFLCGKPLILRFRNPSVS